MHRPSSSVRSQLAYAFAGLFLLALVNGCSDDDSDGSSRRSRRSVDTSTPEDLARATLDTLIDDDRKKFESFMVPGEKELRGFIQENMPEDTEDERKYKEREIERLPRRYPEITERLLKSWDRLRDEGEEDNVVWKYAKFESAEFEIREREGLKTTDIICLFSYNRKTYRFEIENTILFNGRWLTLDSVEYQRRKRGDAAAKSYSRSYRRDSKSEGYRYEGKSKTESKS